MTANLDNIQTKIKAGDIDEAKRALAILLRSEPQNIDAWALLATLLDDPIQQADCYRQILRIDPGNRRSADKLQMLTSPAQGSSPQRQPAPEEKPVLLCPQCGGAMEVHFIGEMQDKRAVCSHCGTEIDLPDSFRRVRRRRTQEQRFGDSHTVEETIIETRHDGELSAEAIETLPPELQEMLRILKEKGPGAIDEEFLQKLRSRGINVSFDADAFDSDDLQALQERGFDIHPDPKLSRSSKTVLVKTEQEEEGFLGWLLSKIGSAMLKSGSLPPTEIVTLAGDALPPEESRKCPNPNCDAVISKEATKCPWCGKSL
jgi:hypothetical protein